MKFVGQLSKVVRGRSAHRKYRPFSISPLSSVSVSTECFVYGIHHNYYLSAIRTDGVLCTDVRMRKRNKAHFLSPALGMGYSVEAETLEGAKGDQEAAQSARGLPPREVPAT